MSDSAMGTGAVRYWVWRDVENVHVKISLCILTFCCRSWTYLNEFYSFWHLVCI